MLIKQFRSVPVRVPDPLRPGRRTTEERLIATGAHQLSHEVEGESVVFDAEDGWFNVPHEVGETLRRFRHGRGERFYTPEEVDEQVRLGAMDAEEQPQPQPKRGKRDGKSDE